MSKFAIVMCCVFVCSVLGLVLVYALPDTQQVQSLPSSDVLVIETPKLKMLESHSHAIGFDSMGDEGHHVRLLSEPIVTENDMWVTGLGFKLHNAPAFTLHHAMLYKMGERDFECPTQDYQPIVSVSQDQHHASQAHFKDGYGVFIPKGTTLVLDGMFHNPEPPVGAGETYTGVSVSMELLSTNVQEDMKELDFHLLRLSDTPCDGEVYTFVVPPHTQSYTFAGTNEVIDASRITIEKPSRIVYWGAHLHGWEGGKSLTVRINGEIAEEFVTTKSRTTPYQYDTPHGQRDILLQPGDVVSIEATYENLTAAPLRGAMGHLGLYIAQE